MSITATFDLLLRGGHVICPASDINGVMDVAIRDGKIAAVQSRHPAGQRQGGRRRRRQAGAARHDRHPRPCLSLCQRALRPGRRHGRRAFRRHHADRSGRPVLHDVSGLPPLHRRAGEDARLRVPVVLSRGRAGGPLLSESLQPGRHRHRRDGEGRRRQSRYRPRHQGACGDRRLCALGHQGACRCRPRSAPRPTCRSTSISASCGACPKSGANGEDADTILERVIPVLRPGDMLAHPFTRHPGGFVNREGKVHAVIRAALDRGLKVDVGHGSHFSYRLGAQGARRRHRSRHAGRRHARLQHLRAGAARHAARA